MHRVMWEYLKSLYPPASRGFNSDERDIEKTHVDHTVVLRKLLSNMYLDPKPKLFQGTLNIAAWLHLSVRAMTLLA